MLKTLSHALPVGYTELEYIQSPYGGGWINSGISTTNNLKIDTRFTVDSVSRILFGGRSDASGGNGITWGFVSGSPGARNVYNIYGSVNNPTDISVDVVDNNPHTLVFGSSIYTIDGITQNSRSPVGEITESNDIYIGTWNSCGTPDTRSLIGKIYYFKIYNELTGALLFNGIACKNSSNVVGLYDTITGTFKSSIGTTQFIAGPEVTTPTKALKEIHELYKRNSDGMGVEYIGELYSKSKNLFKISGLAGSATVSYSGDTITISSANVDSGKTLTDIFPDAQVGQTYYLSRDASSTAKSYIWLRSGGAGGQWSFNNARTLTDADFNGTVKFYGDTANTTIVKMQIEKGSSATAYHSYGAEEIFSAGYDTTVSGATPLTIPDARTKPISWQIDGQSKQGLLPSGYTQLEYLESSGTQWIDTGIVPADKKIGAVVDFQFTDTTRTTGGIFGSNKIDNTDNCQFTVYNSKWRIKLNSYATYGVTYDTDRHTARLNMPDGTSLDSTVYTTTQYTIASTNTNSVYVCGCNYGQSSETRTYTLIGKLYSAKVYDDTTLVRNLIPAKNSSNVLGMYDLVTNQLFTNAGTGDFTAGPVCPTPSCPMEVYGVGDKTENLFNPADKKYNGYTITSGTGAKTPTANRCINVFGWLEAGNYIISSTTDTIGRNLHKYSEEGTDSSFSGWLGGIALNSSTHSGSLYCKTFTLSDRCYCRVANTADVENSGDIMLIKGTTLPTSYIPHGFRVPILQAQNCGMVDLGTLNYTYRGDLGTGVFFTNTSTWTVPKTIGRTNVYINGYETVDKSASQIGNMEICGHDSATAMYIRDIRYTNATTFKQAMSGKYLYYQRTTDTTWTPPTTSTIYLPAPLQKVGTYADDVESDGALTRGVGVKVLDGTESWTDASSGTKHIYYFPLPDRKVDGDYKYGFSSHFEYSNGTSSTCPDLNMFYYGSSNTGFRDDAITSLADWQAFLAAQYAAGTPVIIYYPLTAPTTSTITVPQLSTAKGTNYINAETQVKPSNMSVTYRKRTQ